MKKSVILLLLQLMILPVVNAGETFNLTKQGAHYVFTASINGKVDATILVESGIPALLVDSAYVFNSGILSEMTLTPTGGKEKINLGGSVYKITHKANGTVRIGNSTSYIGEVFVLSNYDYGQYELAVPVMYLHNDLDEGSRIVNLDLGNQRLQMLDRSSLRAKKKAFSKLKMNTETYMGMWAMMALKLGRSSAISSSILAIRSCFSSFIKPKPCSSFSPIMPIWIFTISKIHMASWCYKPSLPNNVSYAASRFPMQWWQ